MSVPLGHSSGAAPIDFQRAPRLALLLLVLVGAIPGPLGAQPMPPRRGPLPRAAVEAMRLGPGLFTFDHAYLEQTRRLAANRQLLERGLLHPEGGSEAVRRLTAVTGTRAVPVFLAKFNDSGPGNPITAASLQQELFGSWPTGTMSDYYSEISYGNLQVVGNVFDWVTVSNTDNYYTGNWYGLNPIVSKPYKFVQEVVALNDAAVDFGQYDNDGPDGIPNSSDDDGYVDFVAIVHPEMGAECDSTFLDNLWSHHSRLSGWDNIYFTNDPSNVPGMNFVRVNDYTIMPAVSCEGNMIEIGVFCHEFGHAFGLPDLYDTNPENGDSEGVGYWCLMGSGPWNTPERPAHMCAWSKARLGWINPSVVPSDLLNWPIDSATRFPVAFKLWSDGTPASEYFLVENRTRDGFDDQLIQEGLLIWHVDESVGGFPTNEVNGDETHKYLDLECEDQHLADHVVDADSLDAGTNRGDSGDPLCDGDVFDSASKPSNVAYNGIHTSVQVKDIVGCGTGRMRADLIVGNPEVGGADLCMRDCSADFCTEPSNCQKFWASPEIYIDNNMDGIIDPPAEGIENRLFAKVRNVGGASASSVHVGFYLADPSMGLLFPSMATEIDADDLSIVGAGNSDLAQVLWDIPVPPPSIDHYCVGVVASHPDDPPNSEQAPEDDNVAQINIQELYAKEGDATPLGRRPPSEEGLTSPPPQPFMAERIVRVCNPGREPCTFEIRIGSPPLYDDAVIPPDWTVTLDFTTVTLGPGQCVPLRVHVRDAQAVHLDQCIVPLTLLCHEQPVGGDILGFHIDNVAPRPPCTFTAELRRSSTDNEPGVRAVRLSWSDDFSDQLGFPERVERWRVYLGADPGFMPGPLNLIQETCIDEDPSTVRYEHLSDAPNDSTLRWYKLIAVDRAGNASQACVAHLEPPLVGVGEPAAPGLRLRPNSPNPFSAGTLVRYELPRSGDVEVRVFSVDGRVVRTLVDGTQGPGSHQVIWDGRDESWRPAASGTYVCRLTFAGAQLTRRMTRIR